MAFKFALIVLGLFLLGNTEAVKGLIVQREYLFLQHGVTALVYKNGVKDLNFERCFQILWQVPEGVISTTSFLVRLGTLAKDLTLEASVPDKTNTLVKMAVKLGVSHGKPRQTYKVVGQKTDEYLAKNVSVIHGKMVRRVELKVLSQLCLSGKPRRGRVSEHISVHLRYRKESSNTTIPGVKVGEGGNFYLLEGTSERFAAQEVRIVKEVHGIHTIQLPDAGYEAFGIRIQPTHDWYYSMSLWWFSNGKAIAPVIIREYEDPNIRLVIPALDVSQFAYENGFSGSWTGTEWGFNERAAEWTLMNPYGTIHDIIGAQNKFDSIPVGGMTPIHVYSRQREHKMYATQFSKDDTWVHSRA